MERNEVLEEVVRIVTEQMGTLDKEVKVTETTHLFDDLGADSLDAVEIIMELEDRFEVQIPDEMSEQVKTVGQIVDGVLGLLDK